MLTCLICYWCFSTSFGKLGVFQGASRVLQVSHRQGKWDEPGISAWEQRDSFT